MPILQEFTAKTEGAPIAGGRRAESTDFGMDLTDVGHQLEKTGNRVQELIGEDEARQVMVADARISAEAVARYAQAQQTGEPLEPIKEAMNAQYEKVREGITTQKAASHLDYYMAEADKWSTVHSNTINVARAKAGAVQGVNDIKASAGQALISNPALLPVFEQRIDDYVRSFSGLNKLDADKIINDTKHELNSDAASFAARNDPTGTIKRLEAGEWNLEPKQRLDLLAFAKQQENGKRVEQSLLDAQQHKEKLDRMETSFSGFVDKIMAYKGGPTTALWNAISSDPNLKDFGEKKIQLQHFMQSRANELKEGAPKSDPVTERRLWLAANAPEGTPGKIYNIDSIVAAVAAGKLSTDKGNSLIRDVRTNRDVTNVALSTRIYQESTGFSRYVETDPAAVRAAGVFLPADKKELENIYTAYLMTEVNERIKANKSPQDLFNPSSPDYVGRPDRMARVIAQMKEQKKAQILSSAVPANTLEEQARVPVGAFYYGDDNEPRKQTPDTLKAIQEALGKRGASTTPEAYFKKWMQETGGALKPGQSQAEALAEWTAKESRNLSEAYRARQQDTVGQGAKPIRRPDASR